MEGKDNIIEENLKAIDEAIAKLNEHLGKKYTWNTSCSLTSPTEGKTVNIKTMSDIDSLAILYSDIKSIYDKRKQFLKDMLEKMEIKPTKEYYSYCGYQLEDWMHDIGQRAMQVAVSSKRKILLEAKTQLEQMYSDGKKEEIKFNALLDGLKDLI